MPATTPIENRVLSFPLFYQKLVRILFLTVATLVFFHTFAQYARYELGHLHMFGFTDLFHLDRERNLPTFFSSLLLLASAILLASIYQFSQKNQCSDSHYWLLLAVIFFGLATDESTSLHERFTNPVRETLGVSRWYYFAWIIPASVFLLVFGTYLIRFLWRLPTSTRVRFLVAGSIYVGGAIGIEMVGGYYAFLYGKDTLWYNLIATVEEAMEMTGVVLFIHALFMHIHCHLWNKVVISLRG